MAAPPVQYVTTRDGFNIAFCDIGEGRAFVFLPHPTTHLNVFWTQDTFVRGWYEGLAQRFRFINYDGRGQGMSTRGLPDGFLMDDLLIDLEAVVERAGLDRFVLMGIHWSGHTAIRYAVQHPDRVEALIIASCPGTLEQWSLAMLQGLADNDWEAYLRTMAALANAPDIASSVQRLTQTVNQHDWQALMHAAASSDIRALLPVLRTPTLVLHPRESLNLAPEESMKVAAAIPGARMTLIDGSTPFGEHVPGIAAIESFLSSIESADHASENERRGSPTPAETSLSAREVEVLRLLAAGKSNAQIADELVISQNTVIRHVSNIFAKIDVANRAEAGAYAHRQGLA